MRNSCSPSRASCDHIAARFMIVAHPWVANFSRASLIFFRYNNLDWRKKNRARNFTRPSSGSGTLRTMQWYCWWSPHAEQIWLQACLLLHMYRGSCRGPNFRRCRGEFYLLNCRHNRLTVCRIRYVLYALSNSMLPGSSQWSCQVKLSQKRLKLQRSIRKEKIPHESSLQPSLQHG